MVEKYIFIPLSNVFVINRIQICFLKNDPHEYLVLMTPRHGGSILQNVTIKLTNSGKGKGIVVGQKKRLYVETENKYLPLMTGAPCYCETRTN